MSTCLGVFFVLAIIIGLIQYLWPLVLIYIGYVLILHIIKRKYFNSEEFKEHKKEIKSLAKEYNEISDYVKELPSSSQFIPPKKEDYSHLAVSENTSKHNYVRDRKKKKHDENTNVHKASLAVVRRAEEEPIQYLTKYFNIEPTEESLHQLQEIETNISRSVNAIDNLEKRRKKIGDSFTNMLLRAII
ncbi:MAG: hypothetical protein KBT36_01380 [Kurthia sp.]|nr:hypothetical protein [Candidatus Kurthia equi]